MRTRDLDGPAPPRQHTEPAYKLADVRAIVTALESCRWESPDVPRIDPFGFDPQKADGALKERRRLDINWHTIIRIR